ncbi:hypothetical protein L9F63_018040, partial [Diploptera punctata]
TSAAINHVFCSFFAWMVRPNTRVFNDLSSVSCFNVYIFMHNNMFVVLTICAISLNFYLVYMELKFLKITQNSQRQNHFHYFRLLEERIYACILQIIPLYQIPLLRKSIHAIII